MATPGLSISLPPISSAAAGSIEPLKSPSPAGKSSSTRTRTIVTQRQGQGHITAWTYITRIIATASTGIASNSGVISAAGLTNYLAMTSPDYLVASLKHWLHKGPVGTMKVSMTLSDSAGPVPSDPALSTYRVNAINYAYHGQTDVAFEGDVAWVSRIRYAVGDPISSQTRSVYFYRNQSGHPTNII